MKNLYIAYFLILFLMAVCPSEMLRSEKQMVIEMTVTSSDTTFRYTYAYDGLGQKVLETVYYQVNSDWARLRQTEYQYQGSLCLKQIERKFENSSWVQHYVIDFNYDNDRLVTVLHTVFDGVGSIPYQKISNTYTLSNLTNRKVYTWKANDWKLTEESANSYFGDGRLLSSSITVYDANTISSQYNNDFLYDDNLRLVNQTITQKSSDGLSWLNVESINWLYVQNSSSILSQRNKKWNAEMSKWVNTQKIDYEYGASNRLISETYQAWKLMFWDDVAKYSYEYNVAGNLLKTQVLLPIYKQWRCQSYISYSNIINDKPNILESKFDFWGGTQNEPVSTYIPFLFNDELTIKRAQRIEITRGVYTGIVTAVDSQAINSVLVYPNPSDGVFYINTNRAVLLRWSICDLNGRLIKRSSNTIASNVVDLTELVAGIYYINVVTNKTSESLKLIKH